MKEAGGSTAFLRTRIGIRRWIGFFSAFFFLGSVAYGLDPHLALSQYGEDIWLKRDGLPTSAIKEIAQTSDGYLWLGTAAGLIRFDGDRFAVIPTNPTEPSRREPITALCLTSDHGLWIGIGLGGIRQLKDGVATIVDIGQSDPTILRLYSDHLGVLRAATPMGLYQFDGRGEIKLSATKTAYITGVTEDPAGRLWVTTHGDIEFFDGQEWKIAANEPEAGLILADTRGNIWIGCPSKLLCYTQDSVHTYNVDSGLLGNHITALCEDRDHNIWAGTTAGLNRLVIDQAGNATIDHFALPNILALKEDREGSLWVGTENGLHRFKNVNVVPWTVQEGILGNLAPAINGGPDGSIYIFSKGNPNGVTRLRNGTITHYADLSDGPSYVARDGSLWVSSNNQLARLRDGAVKQYTLKDGVPDKWIAAITEDQESIILCLSTMSGICRWSPEGTRPYLLKDGTAFTVPYHIAYAHRQKDGTIWMGGYDGLWRVKDGEVTRFTTKKGMESKQDWYAAHPQSPKYFHTIITPGLADDWVDSIAEDNDGTLWIASPRGGLTRLKNDEFHSFTAQDGLLSNQICSVLVDDFSNVWMGTPFGIYRVSAKDFEERASGQSPVLHGSAFNSSDGMKVDECINEYQPAAWKGIDGKLWFGTHEGAVSIDPAHLRSNDQPPNVVLEDFIIDGKTQNRKNPKVVVEPGGNKFEFHYTALSFLNPERVKFKYKLEGYDQAWMMGDDHRVAYYTRLPPGPYRFLVIACNNDGVWSPDPTSLSFVVTPFFFQTGWFYFLCAIGAATLVFGAHRLHIRRLYARENELKVRVDQRTFELSQSNEELRKEVNERQRAEREVERVHQQLLTASHKAGMAEVAAGVLHNVGNVLNSVNVTTSILVDTLSTSKIPNLGKVATMLSAHKNDLGQFITTDPKGAQLPLYINGLAAGLSEEHAKLTGEVTGLRKHIEHIKDIVAMQQNYAGASGVSENLDIVELVEESLLLNDSSASRQPINLIRDYPKDPIRAKVERHKVLQILVNLIQNARRACEDGGPAQKEIVLQVKTRGPIVSVAIIDNGVGIPADNLSKIFIHGFTTKKDGHGFGLHSSVLSARSLGGDLRAESKGVGQGASFILEIPLPKTVRAS